MAKTAPLVPELDIQVEGDKELARGFVEYGDRVGVKVSASTRNFGVRLRNEVRAGARAVMAVTDYDTSIDVRMTGDKDRPRASVGTKAPQAHRLEYGFVGRDSRGRYVEQAPRPHFRPALDRMRGAYRQSIAEAVRP